MPASQGPIGSQKASKAHAYEKRNKNGISAPVVWLDDSEFEDRPIAESPKAKGKKRTKRKDDLKAFGRKIAVGDMSEFFTASRPSSSKRRGKGRRPMATNEPNPLLEFFANENIEIKSASEPEAEVDEEADEDEETPEEDDFNSPPPSKRPRRSPACSKRPQLTNLPRPFKAKPVVFDGLSSESEDDKMGETLKRKSHSPPAQSPKRQKLELGEGKGPSNRSASTPNGVVEDNSDTEFSDEEQTLVKPVQKAPPALEQEHTGSTTEDDTEDESPTPSQTTAFSQTTVPIPADDSATESDHDVDDLQEALHAQKKKPKPGFELKKGQQIEPPLVLDRAQGIKVPSPINTYLRPYQRDGIQFFWRQYSEGRGGLLGDDMGLGKTIQVISFLSAIMKKEGISSDRNRRKKYVSKLQDGDQWIEHRKLPPANAKWPTCLIVCPNALVHNWEREFEKWGYFEVGMYMDNKKIRQPVLHDFVLGRLDVVITSYDFVQSDVELLCDLPWSCIFVDEVHKAKNDNSKTADALHQFQCRMRFGLTGTLIQNSYDEMWSILDWTNPGKVGTKKQWAKYVVKPLTDGQSTKATDEERAKSLTVARVLKDKLLPRSFLRRTKDIIKDQLPKKTDEVVFCPLSPAQVEAYRRILQTSEVQNLLKRNEQCDCGSPKTRKECCHPFQVANVFKYMSILIKLSNHLCLILPGSPDDTLEQAKRNRETATIAFPDGNVPVYGVAEMQPQFCGKWSACNVLFKEWRKDRTNKVLLFTKSVKLLKMLEYHLSRECMDLIDQFQDDPNVFIFLVSTLAGGTGLNLTAANKVIIFDPNWNPAHDLQAMDRSYRFGQQRDVSVFRLLGAGSVEELIYARQIYKQQQMAIGYDASIQTRYFEGVQGDNSKRGELFGLENIFKLHEDKIATKMAIEKAHMSELDWALANLKVEKNKKIRVGEKTNALFEAEAKATAKDEISLNGLGALLFDDDPTIAEGDDLRKALGAIGVQYSHMNDEILVPSKIEEERAKQSMKKRGERTTRNKSKEAEKDQLQWPPRRKHHKAKAEEALTPEERLYSRRQALIALGSITCPADLPGFARNFARETDDAQLAILAELDHWQSQHGG